MLFCFDLLVGGRLAFSCVRARVCAGVCLLFGVVWFVSVLRVCGGWSVFVCLWLLLSFFMCLNGCGCMSLRITVFVCCAVFVCVEFVCVVCLCVAWLAYVCHCVPVCVFVCSVVFVCL